MGYPESLEGSSSIEAEDHQEMFDLALHNYLGNDRYLTRGNISCIYINSAWKSPMCLPSNQKMQHGNNDIIYFNVNFPILPFILIHVHEEYHT